MPSSISGASDAASLRRPASPSSDVARPATPPRQPSPARAGMPGLPPSRTASSAGSRRPASSVTPPGRERVDETTTIALRSVGEGGRVLASASPAAAAEPASAPFPRTLADLQAAVLAQQQRPVDKAAAAAILRDVRAQAGAAVRHGALAGRITTDQVARWDAALGLSRGQRRAMRNMAFAGGLLVPSSNTVFNTLNYLVVPMLPFVSERMQNPWAQAGLSLALAAVAQPLVTAPLQTYIVAAIDVMRQKNAPSVQLDKASINAKFSPRQLEADIEAAATELADRQQALGDRLDELARAKGIEPPQGARRLDAAHVGLLMPQLSPDESDSVQVLAQAGAQSLRKLGELASSMQVAEGVHARQWRSTRAQIAPRTLRAGSGAAAPFVKARGEHAPGSWVDRVSPNKLSSLGAAGLSAGLAMAFQFMQHLAAGFDEVTAQSDEHKLNMLHADVTTPEGKAALARGEQLQADHLDEAKLRKLVALPETQMVNRVAGLLKKQLAALKDEVPEHDLEAGDGPPSAQAQAAAARVAACEAEIAQLEAGHLDRLPADGRARPLLDGVLQRFSAGYALREGQAKLNQLEFSAQYGQRLGQALTFGGFGSVGAVAAGRVISAALGGHDQTALSTEFGLALGGMALGAFSAATQWTVVNVKNERREGDMSFARQVWNGVISPLLEAADQRAAGSGTERAAHAFAANQQAAGHALQQVMDAVADETPSMPGSWRAEFEPASEAAAAGASLAEAQAAHE